ncbi:GIY-YIG nuclease family protein [Candidatus Daviesbacteria bacterium]|nr:GIY-YIG nuclease family protein [Candidatus Daviesbacteria bacterium]
MIPKNLSKEDIPHKSGVYIFKDLKGDILYVGKAVDLKSRVASYFRDRSSLKTAQLVESIADIVFFVVESELEALILEANLIKKNLPTFNVRLTDNKDYLYIKVTKEKFPRIITSRKQELSDALKYFGPFPSSRTVNQTLKKIRRVFPWCSNPSKITIQSRIVNSNPIRDWKARPCFYYHLRLCPGACIGLIDAKEYRKIINRFIKFIGGEKEVLLSELQVEMKDLAKNLQFEKAETLKKTISGIEYITQPTEISMYLDNPNFLEDQNKLGLKQLMTDLKLPNLPKRIEGYDISNIQGGEASGSLVVLANGEIDKSQYRKFKIKITGKPNDVAMLSEMMRRRLNHPEWPFPDLIIIDGGRGQVRGVAAILEKREVSIPIFGLAKKMERLYPIEGEIVKIPKRRMSLRLLQKIRDESHRFALNYHLKLRSKKMFSRVGI